MSTGPSTSTHTHSYSVDPPRGDAVSSAQLPLAFGPGLEAGPRNPNPNPPPPFPLAVPTRSSQTTSAHSVIDTIPSTPFQPRVPSQTFDQAPSDDEPRNRLFDGYVLAASKRESTFLWKTETETLSFLPFRLFFRDGNAHPGWVKYIHLDGSIYYRHTSGRLLTPDDVTQPRIRECFERLLSLTISTLRGENLLSDLPQDFEIIAERMDPEVPEVFYFASQSLRSVINYGYACPCGPNPTNSHPREQCPSPRLRLEKTPGTRFWMHLASYPMHITTLPPHSEADFLKALTQGANERILDERKSMFPYTDQQAQRFMQVYRDLKCVPYGQDRHSILPALAWHISRVMIKIEAVRERYHYGTKEARLYRDIAVDAPTRAWRERLLDVVLLSLFFNAHRTYRDRLESTRPKGHVYLPDFRELMSSLLVEWSDSNLLATVFVSANVAFLAVPNISALPQTASLCSTLLSMLSMVIGVHHVWRHRRRADADDDEASQYLRVRSRGERGDLTLLACFLALPLAALLWAILSFTIAIGALCFSSAAGADLHMRALFAGVLGVLLSLAVLTLLVFWDAWRSPPTTEPEEDYARGVGARKPGREGWLKHARRRMRIVRADAMDGMQIRMEKMRTVVRRAVSTVKTTDPTTLEDSDVRATRSLGIAGTENTVDV